MCTEQNTTQYNTIQYKKWKNERPRKRNNTTEERTDRASRARALNTRKQDRGLGRLSVSLRGEWDVWITIFSRLATLLQRHVPSWGVTPPILPMPGARPHFQPSCPPPGNGYTLIYAVENDSWTMVHGTHTITHTGMQKTTRYSI